MYGRSRIVTANFARPANATPYTAGQIITPNAAGGAAVPELTFPGVGDNIAGASGYITKALLVGTGTISSAFNLLLFSATLGGGKADAAALDFTVAQSKNLIGVINFPASALSVSTAGTVFQNTNCNLAFSAAPNTGFYALLQTVGGFTPVSGQIFNLSLFLSLY